MIAWGDVATWVGLALTVWIHWFFYRKNAASKRPRLVFHHELIPAPTLKGFRRVDGVKVRVVNVGGSPSFTQAAYWGRDGEPLREALPDRVRAIANSDSSFSRIGPGEFREYVAQDFGGGADAAINEFRMVDLEGRVHAHGFELVPARGYIAVFPGDWPPKYDVRGFDFVPSSESLV